MYCSDCQVAEWPAGLGCSSLSLYLCLSLCLSICSLAPPVPSPGSAAGPGAPAAAPPPRCPADSHAQCRRVTRAPAADRRRCRSGRPAPLFYPSCGPHFTRAGSLCAVPPQRGRASKDTRIARPARRLLQGLLIVWWLPGRAGATRRGAAGARRLLSHLSPFHGLPSRAPVPAVPAPALALDNQMCCRPAREPPPSGRAPPARCNRPSFGYYSPCDHTCTFTTLAREVLHNSLFFICVIGDWSAGAGGRWCGGGGALLDRGPPGARLDGALVGGARAARPSPVVTVATRTARGAAVQFFNVIFALRTNVAVSPLY